MSVVPPVTSGGGLDLESGHLLIVGGGVASVRLCATLRRKKFRGPITLLAAEQHPPYDRPPLSKDVLLGKRDDTTLPFDVTRLDIDLRPGARAVGLSTAERTVHLKDEPVRYDALAIATGATPMRLPGAGPQRTLRTLDDALALRAELRPGARVVVIGASWIGAEVSTAAVAAGCQVTCLEFQPEPFAGVLGKEVGSVTRTWWRDVDLRTGTVVASVETDGVHLSDGEVVPADVVLTGVGVRPDLSWLEGSGVEIDRGVLTDTRGRTNVAQVVAVGDVAQRWSRHTGSYRLAEHWDEANTVSTAAAGALLNWRDGPEHDPVPYFWSDLFGRSLQYVGAHSPSDSVQVEVGEDGSLTRALWTRQDVLTAWLGVDARPDVVKARTSVGHPVDELD